MFNWNAFSPPTTPATESRTPSRCQLILLRHYQILSVAGPDAKTFLQGQCTCDFNILTTGQSDTPFSYGAHCSAKGRMFSSFVAAPIADDHYGLRMREDIAESALSALKKYSVFSKAELTISDQWASLGLIGDSAEALARDIQNRSHAGAVIFFAHNPETVELWIETPQLPQVIASLQTKTTIGSTDEWIARQIRLGLGEVEAATQEQLLPQEINLQLTGGIDFKKGCYTGQEIIARLHYRGQLKKHMYLGQSTTSLPIRAGADIIDRTSEKKYGSVINSIKTEQGQLFLALVSDEAISAGALSVIDASAPDIQWLELPYAIT